MISFSRLKTLTEVIYEVFESGKAAGMIEATKDMDKSLSYNKIIEDLAREYSWDDELVSKMHEYFEGQIGLEDAYEIIEKQVNKTVEDPQFIERLKEKLKEKERLQEKLEEKERLNKGDVKINDEDFNKIIEDLNQIIKEQINKMAEDPQFIEGDNIVCALDLIKDMYKLKAYDRIIRGLVRKYNWGDELVSRLINHFDE